MDVYNKIFDELITRDVKSISMHSGSELLDGHKIKLDFFEKKVVVDLHKRGVSYLEKDSKGGSLKVGSLWICIQLLLSSIIFKMQMARLLQEDGYHTESCPEGFSTGRPYPVSWILW